MIVLKNISYMLSYPKARIATIVVASAYMILYLFLIGDLTYSAVTLTNDAPSLQILDDWTSSIFKQRVSFNYEAIASVYFTNNFAFLVSVPNLLLGGVVAALIGLNVGFLIFALEKPKVCGIASKSGILASIPTLFMGFTCCAPTLLLALGSAVASLTLGFIALRSIFYPLAVAGLLISLWINLKRMQTPAQ